MSLSPTEFQDLPYTTVYISSEDPDAIIRMKMNSGDFVNGKGWISGMDPYYPQEIILRLNNVSRILRVELLSHHLYIPTKVEVLIGQPRNARHQVPKYETASYTRLASAQFRNNDLVDRKALHGERKVMHTGADGLFVKLVVHANHKHPNNTRNQVGLLSIKLFGDKPDFVSMSSSSRSNPKDRDRERGDNRSSRRRHSHASNDSLNYAEVILRKNRIGRLGEYSSSSEDEGRWSDISDDELLNLEAEDNKPEKKGPDRDSKFYFDFSELENLHRILDQRKADAIRSENYLQARQIKSIKDKLSEKQEYLQLLVVQRSLALDKEMYAEAHEAKTEFEEIWYTATHEFRHLPKYLTEEERHRYIECFGVRPDDNGQRHPWRDRYNYVGHINSYPVHAGTRHYHQHGEDETNAKCYIHESHHAPSGAKLERQRKEMEEAMRLGRGEGIPIGESDEEDDPEEKLRQMHQNNKDPLFDHSNSPSVNPIDETKVDPNGPTDVGVPEWYDTPGEQEPVINRHQYDRLDVSAYKRDQFQPTGSKSATAKNADNDGKKKGCVVQ